MAGQSNAPVIIKRKKVVAGGGHHGGAWKVAYADFVTAMMAFFMLMWLLNATTEQQRSGIADYFSPTIPLNRISGGGDGTFGGDSVFTEDTLARNGAGATVAMPVPMDARSGAAGDSTRSEEADADSREREAFSEIEKLLVGSGGESMVSQELLRHVVTRQTDEGLIIELFDLPGAPLYAEGDARTTAVMEQILGQLAQVFNLVKNEIAIGGHVAAQPVVLAETSSWKLSADRADAARRLLDGAGLKAQRVQRVTGFSDRRPVVEDPMMVRNNRLEIILLRDGR
jgi:chemotaxis protein MotB